MKEKRTEIGNEYIRDRKVQNQIRHLTIYKLYLSATAPGDLRHKLCAGWVT